MHGRSTPSFTGLYQGRSDGRISNPLLIALGAEREEREGSRVAFVLNAQVHVFHRPHPSPETDKGAVVTVKRILEANGVTP